MENSVQQYNFEDFQKMSEQEASIFASQMLSVINALKNEKEVTDSMVNFLNNQKAIQKVIYFITGKNHLIKKDIENHKDNIIDGLINAVDYLTGNVIQNKIHINNIYQILIYLYGDLAMSKQTLSQQIKVMIEKIETNEKRVDAINLRADIENGVKFNAVNSFESLLLVLIQLDDHVLSDNDELERVKSSLKKIEYLSDETHPIKYYMSLAAEVSDKNAGVIGTELLTLSEFPIAKMLYSVLENYNYSPNKYMENPKGKIDVILDYYQKSPLCYNVDYSVSSLSLFNRFVEAKRNYLKKISDVEQHLIAEKNGTLSTSKKPEVSDKKTGYSDNMSGAALENARAFFDKKFVIIYKHEPRYIMTAYYIKRAIMNICEIIGAQKSEAPVLIESETYKKSKDAYNDKDRYFKFVIGDAHNVIINKTSVERGFFGKNLFIYCEYSKDKEAVRIKHTPFTDVVVDDTLTYATDLCRKYHLPVMDEMYYKALKEILADNVSELCRRRYDININDPESWLVLFLLGGVRIKNLNDVNKIAYNIISESYDYTDSARLIIAFYKFLEWNGVLEPLKK